MKKKALASFLLALLLVLSLVMPLGAQAQHFHNTRGTPRIWMDYSPYNRDEHHANKMSHQTCSICGIDWGRETVIEFGTAPHVWEGETCGLCGYIAPTFKVLEVKPNKDQCTVGDTVRWMVTTNDPTQSISYRYTLIRGVKEEVYQSPYTGDNSFTYTLNKGGRYSVKVEAMRGSPWSSTVGHSLSIEAKLKKADLSLVKWDYDPANPPCFNYQPHKVQVTQAPEGLSVNGYSYQEATMPGTHRTLAYFNYDPEVYEDPRTAALYWKIIGPKGPELAIDRTANGMMIRMLDEGFATSHALYRKHHGEESFQRVYEGEDSFFEDTDAEYGESYVYTGVSIVKYENENYPGPYGPRTTITVLDSVDTSLCKHICPQRYAPDLDSSDEGGGILCVPSSNSAPALEV